MNARLPGKLKAGVGIVAAMLLVGVVAQFGQILDPFSGDLDHRFAGPGDAGMLLGSDQLGRSMLARTAAGVAWSMSAAAAATVLALAIGTLVGTLAAELSARWRKGAELLVNTFIALPGLILAIIVAAMIGQGWHPVVLTLGLVTWPVFARVVLAQTLALRNREFVVAARLLGRGRLSVIVLHILPSLGPTLFVMAAFHFADMLIAEGALSFLGFAAPLGEPTWGNLMADSRPYVFTAPWMLLSPAGAIILAVVAANLIGDGLARLLEHER